MQKNIILDEISQQYGWQLTNLSKKKLNHEKKDDKIMLIKDIDKLNLSRKKIVFLYPLGEKIQLADFTHLVHLDLSRNYLKSLVGIEKLIYLESLNIYKNKISKGSDILLLKKNIYLEFFDSRLNIVSRNSLYRPFVIQNIPTIKILDEQSIIPFERRKAREIPLISVSKLDDNNSFNHVDTSDIFWNQFEPEVNISSKRNLTQQQVPHLLHSIDILKNTNYHTLKVACENTKDEEKQEEQLFTLNHDDYSNYNNIKNVIDNSLLGLLEKTQDIKNFQIKIATQCPAFINDIEKHLKEIVQYRKEEQKYILNQKQKLDLSKQRIMELNHSMNTNKLSDMLLEAHKALIKSNKSLLLEIEEIKAKYREDQAQSARNFNILKENYELLLSNKHMDMNNT